MARLSLFYFLFFSTQAVFISFVPLYLKDLGLGTSQIGSVLAMGSVVTVFSQPVWGFISDRIQSSKRTLLIVLCATLVGSLLFFSVKTYLLIILCFLLVNMFRTSCGPLADNIAVLYTKKHNKNYGMVRVWGDVGVGTSSLLLGILTGVYGIEYLGWMYTIILLAAIPLAFTLIDSSPKKQVPITVRSLGKLIKNRKYISFIFVCLIIFVPHRMNDSLFSLYISGLGASEALVGKGWMIATFASLPAFILTGYLVKRVTEWKLIVAAAILYSVRWFLYSQFDDPVMLTYLQVMQGVTFPIFSVAALIFITKIVPENLIATGQMFYAAMISGLGGIIGGAGGGWFMETYSSPLTYRLCSLLCLSGAILYLVISIKSGKNRKFAIEEGSHRV
ncbi:MFS transporter [Bacillus sp. MRMR6]|uniref:MFS transporter n=1 Tax=Bacillus sp. MRMR6 TaxID=1928617 RepID=UPI000952D231|nr:MFS transporter [Bacillus sp. MRMR6]OLS42166.1 hypothetical protein BTR25_02000 [Bacillus sp. MRMR6]